MPMGQIYPSRTSELQAAGLCVGTCTHPVLDVALHLRGAWREESPRDGRKRVADVGTALSSPPGKLPYRLMYHAPPNKTRAPFGEGRMTKTRALTALIVAERSLIRAAHLLASVQPTPSLCQMG